MTNTYPDTIPPLKNKPDDDAKSSDAVKCTEHDATKSSNDAADDERDE